MLFSRPWPSRISVEQPTMSIYRHCRTQLFLLLSGFSSFWTASVLASSGCGVTSLSWKFTSDGHSNQTVGGRAFWVHLPTDYDSNTAAPLVLSYHGYGVSQTTQEMISGFSDPGLVINGTGIVAVYPLGAYGPGQPGDGPSPAWQGSPVAAVCQADYRCGALLTRVFSPVLTTWPLPRT